MESTTTRKKFAKWASLTHVCALETALILKLLSDFEVELVGLNNEEATNLI